MTMFNRNGQDTLKNHTMFNIDTAAVGQAIATTVNRASEARPGHSANGMVLTLLNRITELEADNTKLNVKNKSLSRENTTLKSDLTEATEDLEIYMREEAEHATTFPNGCGILYDCSFHQHDIRCREQMKAGRHEAKANS